MKYLFLIISIFFIIPSFAQVGRLKKADRLFRAYSYSAAVEKYELLENKTPSVHRKMAQSYWYIHNYEMAEKYYSIVVNEDSMQTIDMYYYAQTLRNNSKYGESDRWMYKFHMLAINDSRAKEYITHRGDISDLLEDKGVYKVRNLKINTEHDDFGVTFMTDSQLVFASTNEGFSIIKRKYSRDHLPFLDMYVVDRIDSNEFGEPKQFYKKLNHKYHEGPASFNDSANFIVFTTNNYKGMDDEGIVKLQLHYSHKIDSKWQKEKLLPFNDDQYSIGHPSLSGDGKILYFTSDMPGGYGGPDIYKAEYIGDSIWSEPINLGPEINTEGTEMFPFYHDSGILIFASDGHYGLGGLDNFIVKFKEDGKLSKVSNLGSPINSNHDDFSVVIDKKMEFGYFSSDRDGGKGSDDIYTFNLTESFKFGKTIKGIAKDDSGIILDSVYVMLRNENGDSVSSITTDSTGAYLFEVETEELFKLTGDKLEYNSGINEANTDVDESVIIANLLLTAKPKISIYCLVTDQQTFVPLDSVSIVLTNLENNEVDTIITDESGDFWRALDSKKIDDSLLYSLVIEKKGYLSKTDTYKKLIDHEGQYNLHEELNFKMGKVEVGVDLASIIDVNPIYFDLGRYNIRKDAANELDKIVKVMNENPEMEIELGSHTDCRGSINSNRRLSDKRAKSSANYIKAKISNPSRIYGKGYGESILVNECECEGANVTPCTEKQHQENRRTEFKIIKM